MKKPTRYCERGEQCTQYVYLGNPAKLRSSSNSPICERCRDAEADAEFQELSHNTSDKARKTNKKLRERPRQQEPRMLESDAERWIKNFRRDEVEVITGHVEALRVTGEAEAHEAARHTVKLKEVGWCSTTLARGG